MRAIVLHEPGPPEALRIEEVPRPEPRPGTAVLRVGAFGLNRSELFTRRGQSPGVAFPRILGIEALGEIVAADRPDLAPGDRAATVMGGMGRAFDGGYAEYVRVPAGQVRKLRSDLPYALLGGLPEMLQTAWGALFSALDLRAGERLLVRGGTTSVGLAAITLARQAGACVHATSRHETARGTVLGRARRRCASTTAALPPGRIGMTRFLNWWGPRHCWTAWPALRPAGRSASPAWSATAGRWTSSSRCLPFPARQG